MHSSVCRISFFLLELHTNCSILYGTTLKILFLGKSGTEVYHTIKTGHQKDRDYFLQRVLKEYYDYSQFRTCIEWYFWETITTERLEKVLLFLKKYRDSKAVALKEYYDYSQISTYTESCQYFWGTIVSVKMWIYRKQERDT